MDCRRWIRRVICCALFAAALALAGCGQAASPLGSGPTVAPTGTSAATVTATVTPNATTTVAATVAPAPAKSVASTSAGKAKGKGLSASDAKAIDAELSAIQGELDKMSVPSDSDFNGVSSGLK
ncbi:MAG: hypothetical protein P4L93_11665 [Coriobacteriia bacterium]|nr:hypothetical protein [Coriobacteriia bacterium]